MNNIWSSMRMPRSFTACDGGIKISVGAQYIAPLQGSQRFVEGRDALCPYFVLVRSASGSPVAPVSVIVNSPPLKINVSLLAVGTAS